MKKTAPDAHTSISHEHRFVFDNVGPEGLSSSVVTQQLQNHITPDTGKVYPEAISINQAVVSVMVNTHSFLVTVVQQGVQLLLFCNCGESKLCTHQAQALKYLLAKEDLRLFFHANHRKERLKKAAYDFGLENEPDLDQHFQMEFQQNRLLISPVNPGLMSITAENLRVLKSEINTESMSSPPGVTTIDHSNNIVVLKQHRYYKHLLVELYHSEWTREGKIKNPMSPVNPQDFLWKVPEPNELKFLLGISKFQNRMEDQFSDEDISALKAVINNPSDYPFYNHNSEISERITAKSLARVQVRIFTGEISLVVSRVGEIYEISAKIILNNHSYSLKDFTIKYNCFLSITNTFYLVDKIPVLKILNLLRQKSGKLLVHASGFGEFKTQLLDEIEDKIKIDYQYIAPASTKQLAQRGFDTKTERLIYLSDFGNFVMIIPVMRYGQVEVAIRTKRQVYGVDERGKEFLVRRNEEEELKFMALMVKQHPYFEEQLDDDLHYFYLHKKRFLEEEWFLKTFEEWGKHDISVLGFDKIEGNKLNPHKVKIDIKVISGLNWFNAKTEVRYGTKKVSLKKIQTAVRNKSKYVKLGDGTFGILPEEWIERFSSYFNSGEITDEDLISIPKINFSAVEKLFEAEMLDSTARADLSLYRSRFDNFTSIEDVAVPEELKGTLRGYQKEGLNWLNFLDDFNFGGCLADDMGLGKSIQIIAFILLQRRKAKNNTNLLVVPTTLVFNWIAEIEKFAPDLKVHVLRGADREKSIRGFERHEVVLCSYNTLLTDIVFLKNFAFNYLFLDESQQIKNPESQRYKAARLLQSRNKIVVTGTPVENNTFDLYSQFSFACPGLLGSKRYFKELYSVPIDRFKDSKRAVELQRKIEPFLLRRTKQQVAKELPEKTEIVLYCEMNEEQRKVYDAYEREFREYISATDEEEIQKSPMNVLKGLTKLRQICNSTKLLNREDLSSKENSSKIDMLLEQIEDNAAHHKMLVFSQFVSMLELIKKELQDRNIGFAMLTGKTKDREAVVTEFQQNEDIKVFLISLKAGGTGLNLTEASYVYLVDPWWNPAVENQAIDRSHRIGQNKNVTAIRLICPNTVEEKIMTLQDSKKGLAKDLITEDTSILKSLSKKELLKLVK